MLAFISHFGTFEILLILAALLLLFGKRLPEVGRSLGSGMMEFKKGLQGVKDEADPNKPIETTAVATQAPPAPEQPVVNTAAAATCPECQAPRPANATFCPNCGAKLT